MITFWHDEQRANSNFENKKIDHYILGLETRREFLVSLFDVT